MVENTNAYHHESQKNLGKTSILPVACEFVTSSSFHFKLLVIYMHFNTQFNSINSIVLFYQVSHVKHKSQVYNYIFFALRARFQSKPLHIRSSIFALFKPCFIVKTTGFSCIKIVRFLFQQNDISGIQRWIKRHPSSNSTASPQTVYYLHFFSFVLNNNI